MYWKFTTFFRFIQWNSTIYKVLTATYTVETLGVFPAYSWVSGRLFIILFPPILAIQNLGTSQAFIKVKGLGYTKIMFTLIHSVLSDISLLTYIEFKVAGINY